jgi:hypothetical protein
VQASGWSLVLFTGFDFKSWEALLTAYLDFKPLVVEVEEFEY